MLVRELTQSFLPRGVDMMSKSSSSSSSASVVTFAEDNDSSEVDFLLTSDVLEALASGTTVFFGEAEGPGPGEAGSSVGNCWCRAAVEVDG